jgi:two-component system sensor histidine kinase KdpD
MASQLDKSFHDLKHAAQAKEEFLGLVSHDLRTPVTTIMGNAHMLANRSDALTEEERAIAIQDIHAESERLKTIIENLLMVARVESGQAIDLEPLIIRHRVTSVVSLHGLRFPNRTYDVLVPKELFIVDGNLYCIEQIMSNLLSNAEKYSPNDAPITIRLARQGDEVVVSVADRGVGLDAAEAAELFSPFYRSAKTTSVSGIGLGLSVCQRLVEAQGGRIWAAPRAGGGSVFSFSLRLAEGADAAAADAPAKTTPEPEPAPALSPLGSTAEG